MTNPTQSGQTEQSITSESDTIVKPKNKFTFSEGIDLYLTHNGNRICANNSSWNGKETIYLNGELVSSRFNVFSRTGEHVFACGDIHYRVVIRVLSMITGELEATLYANDELVDSATLDIEQQLEYGLDEKDDKRKKPSFWHKVSGFAFGFLAVIACIEFFKWLFA